VKKSRERIKLAGFLFYAIRGVWSLRMALTHRSALEVLAEERHHDVQQLLLHPQQSRRNRLAVSSAEKLAR
jgi:hypothetical protein